MKIGNNSYDELTHMVRIDSCLGTVKKVVIAIYW